LPENRQPVKLFLKNCYLGLVEIIGEVSALYLSSARHQLAESISRNAVKPGRQQIANLLPGESDDCEVNQFTGQLGNG